MTNPQFTEKVLAALAELAFDASHSGEHENADSRWAILNPLITKAAATIGHAMLADAASHDAQQVDHSRRDDYVRLQLTDSERADYPRHDEPVSLTVLRFAAAHLARDLSRERTVFKASSRPKAALAALETFPEVTAADIYEINDWKSA